mmetsp:Transcript_27460/g.53895  ORF Transcript_27460/g.53895 Transcript_27460/m.53895 type:complete len:107 (+) Transcript_27460:433-753(+)
MRGGKRRSLTCMQSVVSALWNEKPCKKRENGFASFFHLIVNSNSSLPLRIPLSRLVPRQQQRTTHVALTNDSRLAHALSPGRLPSVLEGRDASHLTQNFAHDSVDE